MARLGTILTVLGTAALAACAVTPPTGPRIAALPPANKPLQVFQQEDLQCRSYAGQASGGTAAASAASANATNAPIAGTAIGAAIGAVIGAAAGNPALGAAVGGGSGLLFGSAAGADQASYSEFSLQQRYDIAYAQCMASYGDSVPPPGSFAYAEYSYGPYYYPYYGPWWWGGGAFFIGGHFHHHDRDHGHFHGGGHHHH
jgi:hypothetical protein